MTNMYAGNYLVTGASGGIGHALSHALYQGGASLVLAGRREDKLAKVSAEVGDAPFYSFDARNSHQVDDMVAYAWKRLGRLDGVAHCVGSLTLKPATSTTDADFDDILARDLKSAFYLVRAAAKKMGGGVGAIVLVSSAAAQHGMPNQEAIAAAKAGVIGLARSAASTLAPQIRVNVVAPGLIDTPLTQSLKSSAAVAEKSVEMFPAERFGRACEVADTIAFLLQPSHAYITGQVWAVDGGLVGAHVNDMKEVEKPAASGPGYGG